MSDDIVELPTLAIHYDRRRDVVTIEGIHYAGCVFRGIGIETPEGAWIQIVKRDDGIVTLRSSGPNARLMNPDGSEVK